jgi:hypothetical protein
LDNNKHLDADSADTLRDVHQSCLTAVDILNDLMCARQPPFAPFSYSFSSLPHLILSPHLSRTKVF